jgi:cytochrome P450
MSSADLFDPGNYRHGPPHDLFAEARRREPVSRQALPDGSYGWAVLRHAAVLEVSREPSRYSAAAGGVVAEDLATEQLEMMRHMLLAMDPPAHQEHRRPLVPAFSPRTVAGLEEQVRAVCRSIMDDAARRGEVELVHEVCAPLPTAVIGQLMGLPPEDWSRVQGWAEAIAAGEDPAAGEAAIEMAMYGIEFAARRREGDGRDDLASLILGTTFGAGLMSDVDFGSFFVQLVTAGNDTTKTMLSSGVLALLQHPDQLSDLRADAGLIPGAVEEVLRFANPINYFRRTATSDSVLAGVPIAAGDKVLMVYTSANRDESVFAEPDRFDVRRDPNPHVAFGSGEHFCLGTHLARLEGRVFFEELLSSFTSIELTGEPQWTGSILNLSLARLPVVLRP